MMNNLFELCRGTPLINFIKIITKEHGKIVEYDLSLALSDRQSKATSSKI